MAVVWAWRVWACGGGGGGGVVSVGVRRWRWWRRGECGRGARQRNPQAPSYAQDAPQRLERTAAYCI